MPEGEIKFRPEIEKLFMKLEVDPKSKVFAQLADAYRKSNMVDEAIEIAKKGLEIHPNYAAAHLVLGRCYLEKHTYSLAREELERAANLDPGNSVALKLLADAHFAQGTKGEAIRRYKQVLDMDPLNSEVTERLEQLLPPPAAQEPEIKAPGPIVAGKLPPRTTLTGEEVSDMVDKMFVEKGLEPPPIAPASEVKPPAPEPEVQAPAAAEAAAAFEVVPPPPEPVSETTAVDLEKAYEPAVSETAKASLLGREEVSEVVEGLISEKGLEAPAITPPGEEVSLPEPAPEPTATMAAEVAPEEPPSPSEPQRAPLTGEEVAGIVEGILAERNLGTPAIAPPEMPAMIEQKPPEDAPLVKVEEAASREIGTKAKGIGATATLAELYEQQGFYDKALELYEQVLAEDPGNPVLQTKVGELRNKTYLEEGGGAETEGEILLFEAAKPSAVVTKEEARKEEPVIVAPMVEKPEPVVKPEEHSASVVPEGQEKKGEIKSFQDWLDSLKKPKSGS